MSDLDFTAAERDGWGIPWPIRYADIAPYYDRAEELMGVCGGTDDSDVLPGSRFLMPPPAPRCGEVFMQKACDKLGIPMVAGRRANFTRPHRGSPPCHYCGACGDGCDTGSFFNSADHLIPFRRSRRATSRSCRTRSSRASWWTTAAARAGSSTSTGRPAPSDR